MCGAARESTSISVSALSDGVRSLLGRLTDAHCHPTEEPGLDGPSPDMEDLQLGRICVMSTTLTNQIDTKELFEAYPDRIVPCFGLHPWFSHHIALSERTGSTSSSDYKLRHYTSLFSSPSDQDLVKETLPHLPTPTLLDTFLANLERNLLAHPTALVGEVGVDKAFRVPIPESTLYPHSKSSPLATPISHQLKIVEAQLRVAVRLRRNISFHSVRCPMETIDLLKRMATLEGWHEIHICLHSFGGKPESILQIQKAHSNVFFSWATIISGRSPRFHDLLRTVERDRLLLESDCHQTKDFDKQVWEAFEALKQARGWGNDECVKQLEANWERFVAPPREPPTLPMKKSAKGRVKEQQG